MRVAHRPHPPRRFERNRPILALTLTAALSTACATAADSSPDGAADNPVTTGSAPTADTPVTTSATTGSDPDTRQPRILPVDGDLAEIVFALGLGDRVVATDISATYPPAADALPEIGYQRALAPEPIVEFEPTLVLATDLAGPPETLEALERLGIPVEIMPSEDSPNGPGDKIRAVAAAIGVPDEGDELAALVDGQIRDAMDRAAATTAAPRVGVLYLRGENVQLLLGEGSGVDWLLEAAGAVNVADELGVVDHAPLDPETLVAAAPDVLIVTEAGLASVGGRDGLLAMPAVSGTPAGEQRRTLVYDDQFLLGNGPRTGQLLGRLVTDLHEGATP